MTGLSLLKRYTRDEEYECILNKNVMMPMRDGIRLATDIYRPKTEKPVPVIFSKTPYNFNTWRDGEESTRHYTRAYEYVSKGYAYVIQNERGRYFSEGEWDILGPPTTDGYDAFSWMASQEWCNGKIATYGCSSTAEFSSTASSASSSAFLRAASRCLAISSRIISPTVRLRKHGSTPSTMVQGAVPVLVRIMVRSAASSKRS